jgi:hypothetical protein
VTLFSDSILKPKPLSSSRDRRRCFRIPTGAPRLVDSSIVCQARASEAAWNKLIDAIKRAAISRLALLKGRTGKERASCPWERFTGCCIDCRCRGERTVTVDFLRTHYTRLAIEIALLVLPSQHKRKFKQNKRRKL